MDNLAQSAQPDFGCITQLASQHVLAVSTSLTKGIVSLAQITAIHV